MTRKRVAPNNLRLLVNTQRKFLSAFGNVPRKDVQARQPPAAFSHRSRGSPSGPMRRPEKEQLQTTSGFGSILSKKPLQPSEIYPEKTFTPDGFRLWVDPLQKASPAFGDLPRKNVHARLPSAFGQFSAKSLASVRKCTPKRRSGQITSGSLSTPTAKLPKWPVAITRKRVAPDCLRLLVNPFRKISPAARCDDPKKCSSRQLSTLG